MPGLVLVTPPSEEPVPLGAAKMQCRVATSETAEDDLLGAYITTGRETFEAETRVALVRRTLRLTLDCFPHERGGLIRLPWPPLYSLDSVKYVDVDGVQQTLASSAYQVDSTSTPARLLPAWGTSWPATRNVANAVEVQFKAGYGAAADVPALAKTAILLLVAHLFANREAVTTGTIVAETPMGWDRLVDKLRLPEIP